MSKFAQIDKAGNILTFFDGKAGDFPDLAAAGVLKPADAGVQKDWVWNGAVFIAPMAKEAQPDPLRELVREIVLEELAKGTADKKAV